MLKAFERPTVHNNSHWGRSAKGYQPPKHIEPSYYSALLDLCRYFLSRPTWQCCNTDPAAWGLPDVYKDGAWREIALIDGRVHREAIAELYEYLKTGQFERCAPPAQVLEDAFPPDDTLPAMWVPRQREEGASLEKIERQLREKFKRQS
jgi:hypothetical protein